MLLAGLFLAVDQFQNELKLDRKGRKLRVLVPINVRERSDLRRGACNRIAFIQIDRSDRDLSDPDGLAKGIAYELGIIKKYKFEKAVLATIRIMSFVPPFFRWRISRRTCRGTTLLSNVGRPFQKSKLIDENGELVVGKLRLKDVELVAPYYDQTPVVFLFSGYANRFAITLSHDPRVVDRPLAEKLMANYFAALEQLC